ncbi:hypothetical protein THIOM_005268 [Candidatus Thiomargarita nelsonii]|uniref:DUF2325 domain-containing protein n=1 Tax=Candidatus Thiomargarita nelsonii TaxID=1003181 RepID=A0A0A6P1V4_9GAMM|nr:hypothetical protein THIOM_005268 [Candidatus Thiomargarita nelsonii]
MAIIIGADRLGNIEKLLKERGLSVLKHITGRRPKAQGGQVVSMSHAKVMILFTDFVGHNVMCNFRKQAKAQQIPFIACKRNISDLARCLDRYGFAYYD